MKDVAICILTRDRSDRQTTLENLPDRLKAITYLVVDKAEYSKHKKYKRDVKAILTMPKGYGKFGGNFSDKKQWTSEAINERYYFIVDDDLKFDARRDGRLVKANTREVYNAFNTMYGWLKNGFAHVALSAREGNNRVEQDWIDVARGMRVCGFDLNVIKEQKLEFNRTVLMADFDIALSLLESGYPNRILFKYSNGHRKINDVGGCSLYRTPELMAEAANSLRGFHPKYVKVTEKITSKPWAGFDSKTRTDVTVSWKKAYEFGKSKGTIGIKNFL